MAEKTEFLQAIDDAILDADSLERFINGSDSETVLTRLSAEYPTLQNALKQMFRNGGLPATPFDTLVQMQGSDIQEGGYAIVIRDEGNEGFYKKEAGKWVRVPLNMFTNTEKNGLIVPLLKNMLNAREVPKVRVRDWVTSYDKLNQSVKTALVPAGASVTVTDLSFSGTYFALLKPHTRYIIYKANTTNMFRAALFNTTDENITFRRRVGAGEAKHQLTGGRPLIYDEVNTGLISFETSSKDLLLFISSEYGALKPAEITLLEVGTTGKDSVNRYNPLNVITDVGITDSEGETKFIYEADYIGSNALVTYFMPVEPNTTYTISKESSLRFYIAEVYADFNDFAYTRKLRKVFNNSAATQHTFTTSEDVLYLVVYVSNKTERPKLQLEYGDTASEIKEHLPTRPLDNLFTKTSSSSNGGVFHIFSNVNGLATNNLQDAINQATGSTLYIQSGTYQLSGTLTIPSNTKVVGLGKVRLEFVSQSNMTRVNWRSLPVKAYVLTPIDSKNVTLENIEVVGIPTQDNALHWGICIQGSEHTLNNVSVYDVNWIDSEDNELRSGGNGWGLVFYKAQNCRVSGGRFEGSGYENVGTDNASDIVFDGIYCGKGWRTSFQLHRNSFNIVLANSTIKQTASSDLQTHAAVTIHGVKDAPVRDVKIVNCTIDAQISPKQFKPCGGIQTVNGGEHDITVANCNIITNNYGIASVSDGALDTPTNWVITNNRIKSKNNPVKYIGLGGVIANNIFITDRDIVYGSNNQQTVTVANNNIVTPS